MKKIILITGCAKESGLGFQAASLLQKNGHGVIATTRNINNIPQNTTLDFRYLDLTNEQSIIDTVNNVIAQYHRIDVLVNNAAYGLIGAVEQCTANQLQKVFNTVVVGTLRLTQEVLPYMRQQQSGHIINTSSIHATRHCHPLRAGYRGIKAALETMMEAMALEISRWNIYVTNFELGRLTQSITKEYGTRLGSGNNPYEALSKKSMQWMEKNTPPPETAPNAAISLCKLIETAKPPFYYQSSKATKEYTKHWRGAGKSESNFKKLIAYYSKQ